MICDLLVAVKDILVDNGKCGVGILIPTPYF